MPAHHLNIVDFLTVLTLAGAGSSAGAAEGEAPVPACTSTVIAHDVRELSCSVAARAETVQYRLQVNFSGGHDDTIASIAAPEIDGTPQDCAAGSKTRLVGEDGDVSVNCVVSLPRGSTPRRVVVTVKWTHAEYTGHSMTPL